jgi:RNA polymerase sigma-70 factor, ECF subfamily
MADDHEAFIVFYGDTKDKVLTYLMYRLNFDRATSEDLLMDIVLKAYENFHTFDEKKGSFKSWIFRIAHNHLLNHWRDRKQTVSIDKMEENGISAGSVPINDTAAQSFHQKNIQQVLNLMHSHEKEVITLRYLSDLSYEEIAEMTGKKPGAVRTSLSRALRQFRTFYTKLYPQKQWK